MTHFWRVLPVVLVTCFSALLGLIYAFMNLQFDHLTRTFDVLPFIATTLLGTFAFMALSNQERRITDLERRLDERSGE